MGEEQARSIIAKSETETIKETLMATTTEAVEKYGAFGAPWIVAHVPGKNPEPFWGSDRLEALAFYLGKPWLGPVPAESSAKI